MKKTFLKDCVFSAGILMCGVSSYAFFKNIADRNYPDFCKAQVVVNNDTISVLDFYQNLTHTSSGWVYNAQDKKTYNLDSLCNSQHLEEKKQQGLKQLKLQKSVDTIFVSAPDTNKTMLVFKTANADSLPAMPAFGLHNYGNIVIREFKAEHPELQQKINAFNDSHNCTFYHEFLHYKNTLNGMRSWNSYPLKFAECCWDEISVNVGQCLMQRDNYLKNGNNLQYITDRFDFYKEAIYQGKFTPQAGKISSDEASFIAHQIFDSFISKKMNVYMKPFCTRTKYYLRDAPYPAIMEDKAKHDSIMQKFFTIQGHNFWKYVAHRENEILAFISPDMKQEWHNLNQEKFKKINHLEQLEFKKKMYGKDAYAKALTKNKIKSRIISLFYKER